MGGGHYIELDMPSFWPFGSSYASSQKPEYFSSLEYRGVQARSFVRDADDFTESLV